MITVVAGTNRKDSMTLRLAQRYAAWIEEQSEVVRLLSLEDRPIWERKAPFLEMESSYLIPAQKFVFVVPEYNGGIPGILKLLFDNSDIKKCWWHKKALLVGLADGRGGNLRGLDHLTSILHYLKMNIYYNKIPVSRIRQEMDDLGKLSNPATEAAMLDQIQGFLNY